MNDDLLVVQQVRHHFSDSFGRLSDCCLEVPELRVRRGEFLVVTGPSGSGKSTLLNLIGGFLRPLKGLILKNGKPVTGPGPDRITVFQDHAIFPWYTALENTAYGLRAQGLSRQDAEEKAMEALRTVRLEHSAHLYPAALSGGMRQRVALARALALAPDILLLDEPFASVDETGRSHLREELLRLWHQFGWTIIMVTHDLHEAASLADRIAVLHAPPKGLTSLFDIDEARPRSASVIARIHQDILHAMQS